MSLTVECKKSIQPYENLYATQIQRVPYIPFFVVHTHLLLFDVLIYLIHSNVETFIYERNRDT